MGLLHISLIRLGNEGRYMFCFLYLVVFTDMGDSSGYCTASTPNVPSTYEDDSLSMSLHINSPPSSTIMAGKRGSPGALDRGSVCLPRYYLLLIRLQRADILVLYCDLYGMVFQEEYRLSNLDKLS